MLINKDKKVSRKQIPYFVQVKGCSGCLATPDRLGLDGKYHFDHELAAKC